MRPRSQDHRATRAAILIAGTGAAIVALAALMLWAYTAAPTGYTAQSPDAAGRTITGSASGTGGAVSPAQDSGLPSQATPEPGSGAVQP